jgi:two-component system, NtrC family, sensor kinase
MNAGIRQTQNREFCKWFLLEMVTMNADYETLLDILPDLILRLNREGICLDFRPARNFRSFMPDLDWRGRHLSEILPTDLAQKRLFYIEQALQTGEAQIYEQQLLLDSRIQYEEVRMVRCAADEVLVIVRDISDRKYAEQSESRFRKLAENIPGMIYQFRMEATGGCSFPYVSAFSREIFELEPDIIQQHAGVLINLIHPDDCDAFQESVMVSAKTLQPWEWSGRFVIPSSGKVKWIQAHSRPELQTDGAIVWDGLLMDLTERRAAERALQETEAQYRSIFEAVSDAILIRDLKTGMVVDANPAACQMYGYSRDHLLRLKPTEMVHPDSLPIFKQSLEHLQNGGVFSGQAVHIRKDGSFFDIEMRSSLYIDGDKLFALSTIQDISNRKAAEEALRRSEAQLRQQAIDLEHTLEELQRTQAQLIQNEKMSSLGQLVAGIAHEVNNPITFIAGNINHANDYFSDLVHILRLYQKHDSSLNSEIQSAIEEIDLDFIVTDFSQLLESMKAGATRIQKIVVSLRTFSRLDEAAYKTVDIHDGIESTLTILQNRINQDYRDRNIQVIKKYGELPLVRCYAGQLNQVILNVLANAIDALEEVISSDRCTAPADGPFSPTIEIYTEHIERSIRIRVADNGLGVSEDVQSRIFDPFFTTKPVGKGIGMGLATSYQIVTKQHGGTLKCISTSNQGTEFIIEIPIHQTQL